jgi:hypothetical protein
MENTETKNSIDDLLKTLNESGNLDKLVKAINNSTGWSTRQSLSPQVKDITRRLTPILDMLSTEPVINPIHQWDAITSLATGISSYAGPIDSVGVDSDPVITRYSEAVKYYRTTTTVGQFTRAMSRPELPAQPTIDEKAIQSIRYDIEEDLFQGAASGFNVRGFNDVINALSPAANSESASAALTATTNVDNVQRRIVEQGGLATHLMWNAEDRIAFKNIFTNNVRYNDPQGTNRWGYKVQQYLSSFGEVDVLWDQFINAKAGATPVSTGYVLDITSWALGEPVVNGASGVASQELAKTGPANTMLINYYGLLIYRAPAWNGRITNIQ